MVQQERRQPTTQIALLQSGVFPGGCPLIQQAQVTTYFPDHRGRNRRRPFVDAKHGSVRSAFGVNSPEDKSPAIPTHHLKAGLKTWGKPCSEAGMAGCSLPP